MISSVRLHGSTASMALEGATNTEAFRAYVRKVLIPSLRVCDIVVMDNFTPHKNEETVALIEEAGTSVCFLPPLSPDLNPIEKMWSKVKQILRSLEAQSTDTPFHPNPPWIPNSSAMRRRSVSVTRGTFDDWLDFS